MHRFILAACLVCSTAGPALAVDLSSAYSEQELRSWQPKYSDTTNQLLGALLGQLSGQPAVLTAEERKNLSGLKLRFPMPSEQNGPEAQYRGDPLMFYSRVSPPEVVLPVLSLKFFSDVCLAYVWLNAKGYEPASPTIYMKLVKYNRPARFPHGRYPPLLQAVGIPGEARKDGDIEQRYFETFNHLRTFLLLHELGHVYHRDDPSAGDRQKREVDADAFALEVFRRLKSPPLGATIYFTAAANLQLNRADFSTEAQWKAYLEKLSHPANEYRLQQASQYMRRNLDAFVDDPGDRAGFIEMADITANLANLISSREFPMVAPKSALVDLSPLELRKRKIEPKR